MKTFSKHRLSKYCLRFVLLQFLFAVISVSPCWSHDQFPIVPNVSHIKGVYITDIGNYFVYHYEVNAAGELINKPPQAVLCAPYPCYLCSDPSHNYIYVPCSYKESIQSQLVSVASFSLKSDGRISGKRVAALNASQSGGGMPAFNPVYNELYTIELTNKVFYKEPPMSQYRLRQHTKLKSTLFRMENPRFQMLIHSLKFQSGGRVRPIASLSFVCEDFGPLVFDNSGHYAYLPADGQVLSFRVSSKKILALRSSSVAHDTTALIANRTKPYLYLIVGHRIEVCRIETNGHLAPASETTGPVLHPDNRIPYDNQLFIDPAGHFLYEICPEGPLLGFKIKSDGMIDTNPFLASTVLNGFDGWINIQFHPLLHIAYVINGSNYAPLQAFRIQTDGKFVPIVAPPIIVPPGTQFIKILVL